ncbi:hypothetical protein [Photobacterium sanguinicancri]|uniref:hypothetical protein n=1 Tax=Photobacterium sanguinicancri TaxID=875932 RepID=UPI0024808DB3|nr:hypothetical protein [Photobacterium sanguinicancri]
MNMKREQGFSTLLITVVISLIMALYVFSLLSVELFNSKKTQNIIISQELKSMSASGLQCAVDIILRSGQKPTSINYTTCVDSVITAIQIPATSTYKVTSTATADDAESTMSQLFTSSSMNGVQAAFSSSGTISFEGSHEIDPFEGDRVGTGYNCIAIRSGGKVLVNGTLVTRSPLDQYGHAKIGQDGKTITCNSSHLSGSVKSSADFKSDIIENIKDMDLFKENFAVDRDSWADAKSLFDVFITGSKTKVEIPSGKNGTKTVEILLVNNCSKEINKVVEHNRSELKKSETDKSYEPKLKKYIWITGSCDMTGVDYSRAEKSEASVTVVVKDGLITTNGNMYFHGNVYLFDYAMTNDQLLAAWEKSSLKSIAESFVSLVNAPFFFNGSFETRGAFNLDSPNRKCSVRGSFKPGYSKGKVDYEESRFGKTVMLEGSWHDF